MYRFNTLLVREIQTYRIKILSGKKIFLIAEQSSKLPTINVFVVVILNLKSSKVKGKAHEPYFTLIQVQL